MTYIGRTRQIRMARAELRFEAPVWRTYFHDRVVLVALLKARYPDAKTIYIPDDRMN